MEWKNYIIFALHVGAYTHEGTFDAVIEQRDSLKALGVSAIFQPVKRPLRRTRADWYDEFMSRDTEALLDVFEHLPVEERRAFTQEVLRRSLPFDSGPLGDEEIAAASAALFGSLEEEDGHSAPR